MVKSATITGIAIIIFGVWISLEILASKDAPLWVQIYPTIIIIVGITLIALRKKENEIEQRKDIKTKKSNH
ncbi:MAG: hypothetical protein V1889_01775 [archaeon]